MLTRIEGQLQRRTQELTITDLIRPFHQRKNRISRRHVDTGGRHVSTPVKGKYGYEASSQRLFGTKLGPSVRLVQDEDLRPRPLTIRKKASAPVIGSPRESHKPSGSADSPLKARLRLGNASVAALDKLFGRGNQSTLDLTSVRATEDKDKENADPRYSKRSSDDSKARNWFRRSGTSPPKSAGSERTSDRLPQTPPNTGYEHNTQLGVHSRATSHTTSDDLPMRLPPKQSVTSKFWKWIKKDRKDRGVQIAMTSKTLHIYVDFAYPGIDDDHDDFWLEGGSQSNASPVYAQGALANESTATTAKVRHAHFGDIPHQPNRERSLSRPPPPTYNFFTRLLHVKPATHVLALMVSRDRALTEIRSIWRDWRRYGTRDIGIDRNKGLVWASVDENNKLDVKAVTIRAEVFPVAMKGRAQGLAVARFSQERGAKSSFERAIRAMSGVLRGRGVLVVDKKWAKDMRKALTEWERTQGKA